MKHSQPVQEPTLIDAAKTVTHLLNNALSVVLTSSQLAMHRTADLPEGAREDLQGWLRDIEAAATDSGEVVHQFQRFIDSCRIANDDGLGSPRPRITPDILAAGDSTSSDSANQEQRIAPARVGHISVLIVDDEERIRHALSYALTLGGHHVMTASDGQEALRLLQGSSYDIAFVDLKMPGMDGWEVASAIKRMEPDTMLVLMTGWRVQLDDERLKENRVDAVMAKPFDLSQISDLIMRLET